MMTSRRIVDYVTAEPFRPFRVRMASGEVYTIPHPEMIFVGRTTARVFINAENGQREREEEISILLIEAVEPLDAAVSSDQDMD